MTEVALSPSGEAAWSSIRQHAEWTPGFWMGWVFTNHTPSGFELYRRLSAVLATTKRRADWWLVQEPEELERILPWLIEGAGGTDGCVWVAIPEHTPSWRKAWENFLLRLNERRERLRGAVRCGVMFVLPDAFKAMSREAAPDLWSIRSLAWDVAPAVSADDPGPARVSSRPIDRLFSQNRQPNLELALSALESARRLKDRESEAAAQVLVGEALLAAGRFEEANAAATLASELSSAPKIIAASLALQGLIALKDGDRIRAERCFYEAWSGTDQAHRPQLALALLQLLIARQAWAEVARVVLATLDDPPLNPTGARPEEIPLLVMLGDAHFAEGPAGYVAAEEAYRRAKNRVEQLQSAWGENTESYLSLVIILQRIAMCQSLAGQLTDASATLAQAVETGRKLATRTGQSAEASLELANALQALGELQLKRGLTNRGRRLLREKAQVLRKAQLDENSRAHVSLSLAGTLSELADLSNDPTEAQSLRAEAAELRAKVTPP